jgi:hypothetical protein
MAPLRVRMRPTNVMTHAVSATYTNPRAMGKRKWRPVAEANWNVHVVYIPKGKTMPQY